MTESVDRQTAVLRLRGADDILILCHKNPDGDTIGGAGQKRRDFMQRPHPQNV